MSLVRTIFCVSESVIAIKSSRDDPESGFDLAVVAPIIDAPVAPTEGADQDMFEKNRFENLVLNYNTAKAGEQLEHSDRKRTIAAHRALENSIIALIIECLTIDILIPELISPADSPLQSSQRVNALFVEYKRAIRNSRRSGTARSRSTVALKVKDFESLISQLLNKIKPESIVIAGTQPKSQAEKKEESQNYEATFARFKEVSRVYKESENDIMSDDLEAEMRAIKKLSEKTPYSTEAVKKLSTDFGKALDKYMQTVHAVPDCSREDKHKALDELTIVINALVDEVHSVTVTTNKNIIHREWYKTPWFILACIMGGIALIGFGIFLKLNSSL